MGGFVEWMPVHYSVAVWVYYKEKWDHNPLEFTFWPWRQHEAVSRGVIGPFNYGFYQLPSLSIA